MAKRKNTEKMGWTAVATAWERTEDDAIGAGVALVISSFFILLLLKHKHFKLMYRIPDSPNNQS